MRIEKIKSKVTSEVLHYVIRYLDERHDVSREDVIEPENFLQLSLLNYDKGRTFTPHKHIRKEISETTIAQESWVVLRGSVKAIFYDIDDTIIAERKLDCLDISITLNGGHNYEILEDNTLVYEFKSGPYYGIAKDKMSIGDTNV